MAKPIILTIGEKSYTLEFNRTTALQAERFGLYLKDVLEMSTPVTTIPLLFFASFKMHHPEMTRKETDAILYDELQGLSQAEIARFIEIFAAPVNDLMRDESDEERKNASISL